MPRKRTAEDVLRRDVDVIAGNLRVEYLTRLRELASALLIEQGIRDQERAKIEDPKAW